MAPSEVNAVHRHQLSQKGYPTSGISTSPIFEVAKQYAKGKAGNLKGYGLGGTLVSCVSCINLACRVD